MHRVFCEHRSGAARLADSHGADAAPRLAARRRMKGLVCAALQDAAAERYADLSDSACGVYKLSMVMETSQME